MECGPEEKIISIANILIKLLRENNAVHWSKVLENLLKEFESSNNKKEVAALFIKIMRGGMGSFLDMVLQKDGKPLIDENNQLDELRHALYNDCKHMLT